MSGTQAPPAGALDLRESYSLQEGALQSDGTVLIHIIRPGVGRGKGSHYYSPEMLEANAGKWAGVKMYANHLGEKARKALEGLPRPIEHVAGRIIESWWDPSVPADDRFEAGAVVGRVKPVGYVRALIEEDPEIVETSISASATGVQPVTRRGRRAWAVEGIAERDDRPGVAAGSVDFVTEAGAGGRVLSAVQEASVEMDAISVLDDDELRGYIREYRPDLAEALGVQAEESGEGSSSEDEQEGDVAEITAEVLREALAKPENQDVLREVVVPLVESRIDEVKDEIIRDAQADMQRQVDLRDMREAAWSQIKAAKLPEKFEATALRRFDLVEGEPTPALDVFPEVDTAGAVVKSADEKLTESVNAVIEEMRDLAGSVNPTRIAGQGAGHAGGGSEGGDEQPIDAKKRVDPATRSMLRESGMTDEEIDESYTTPLQAVVG